MRTESPWVLRSLLRGFYEVAIASLEQGAARHFVSAFTALDIRCVVLLEKAGGLFEESCRLCSYLWVLAPSPFVLHN